MRFRIFFAVIALFSSFIATALAAAEDVVDVPDDILRRIINETLGKSPDAEITVAEMESLTALNLFPSSLENPEPPSSLEGLRYATNLESLHLREFWFTGTGKFMQEHKVQLEGWDELANLEKLSHLSLGFFLDGVDIDHLLPLENLESLSASPARITTEQLSALAEGLPELKKLSLYGSMEPVSLEFAASLHQLEELAILGKLEGNLSPLAGHPSLRDLRLDHTGIHDLSPLATVPTLESLKVEMNQIVSGEPLQDLPNLKVLNISSNPLTSIDFLHDLPALTEADITGALRFSETTREYSLIETLREEGVTVHYEVPTMPFELEVAPAYVDFNGDGYAEVNLTAVVTGQYSFENLVWRWDGVQADGELIAMDFPLGDTYVEIDYHYASGALFRHGITIRVVDSFTWAALGMDASGNVDTGALVGWIIVPDDSGWVWSWTLDRMIYLPEESVGAAGAWLYLPHDEVIAEKLEGWGDFDSVENWVDTRSLLHWIYAPSGSGWVYASEMSAWIYMPVVNVTPNGVWIFRPQ